MVASNNNAGTTANVIGNGLRPPCDSRVGRRHINASGLRFAVASVRFFTFGVVSLSITHKLSTEQETHLDVS